MTVEPTALAGVSLSEQIIFDGANPIVLDHFPGNPIVPAFVQLMHIRERVQAALNLTGERIRIKTVKFSRIIRPDRSLTLIVSAGVGPGAYRFALADGNEVATQGEFVL